MGNQQKPTDTYTPPNIYDDLDENDRLYVDMRVQGFLCSQIATAAKRQHITVREWFAKDGRLYSAYQLRKAEHRREYSKALKDIDRMVKEGAVDAILKLLEAVRSPGTYPSQIQAARDLLDRAGFQATQKVDAKVTSQLDPKQKDALDRLESYVQSLPITISRQ
jgi:hypothetical protein